MHTPSTLEVDPAVLLGQLALRLTGPSPLPEALDLLVAGLRLSSAVLRTSDDGVPAGVLAVAGEAVHAVPPMRGHLPPQVALDVPVPGSAVVLTVVGARPSQLPALRAAAAVLALAVGAHTACTADAAALLLDGDEDGDLLADALHDGPVQALVVARYACDSAVRGGDPALARDAVQEAVVGLRRTMWHLRARGQEDLPAALAALSERLGEAGQPAPALLLDPAADAQLAAPERALAYRLVQAVARDAGTPVRVALRRAPDGVLLDVDGGRPLDAPDRWRRRVRALGGDLSSSAGRLRLRLPARTPAVLPARTAPEKTEACS